MTEHATSSRGDRVAYDRYGPAKGSPAVVLVAGAGSLRGDDGVATAARLVADEGVTVLVPDRLGRGESEAGGLLVTKALRAVLEASSGHAVLCGHSSGCSISLYAAAHTAAHGLPVDGRVLWEAPVAAPAQQTEVREVAGAHHVWDASALAPVLAAFVRSCSTR